MMKTIETVMSISSTGEIQLSQPEKLPVGRFKVVLVIDESSLSAEEVPKATLLENPSFLSVAGDLIGSLDGLPADLSHNKQYLEGLGE